MDFIQSLDNFTLVLLGAAVYLLLEFGLDLLKELLIDRIKRQRVAHGDNEWGGDDEEV